MSAPALASPLLLAQSGYSVLRSLRFRANSTAYLNRTFSTGAGATRHAVSAWVKRASLGQQVILGAADVSTRYDIIYFDASDRLAVVHNTGGSDFGVLITNMVFRDPSAWYHIFYQHDSTDATAANRMRLWVNGVEVTSFSLRPNIASQNSTLASWLTNTTDPHNIGRNPRSGTQYFDGLLAEIVCTQGVANTVSQFGEFSAVTGAWVPRRYGGSFGSNGFYLDFSDATSTTTLMADRSGNARNWTANNISVTAGTTYDSMVDTPTNNYATLSSLDSFTAPIDGNLRVQGSVGAIGISRATIALPSTGKWYFEARCELGTTAMAVGIAKADATLTQYLGGNASTWSYFQDGNKYTNASGSAYGASWTTNDDIGCLFDADAGTLTFYKNGVSQGQAFSGLTAANGPYFFACSDGATGASSYWTVNFGQQPFIEGIPSGSGALPLCTANLPAPSIGRPSSRFDVVLYTGNGASRSITGLGFSPDLVWIKKRTNEAAAHVLATTAQGATKYLASNLANGEGTVADTVTAFNSDGFSLGADATTLAVNQSGRNYVAWCWDEAAACGFDLVTYTGNATARTIAHSLGVAPAMIIAKARTSGTSWSVYHRDAKTGQAGHQGVVYLNLTNAYVDDTPTWNATAPTSTVFSVGTGGANANTVDYIAYLFAEIDGFSKFGFYIGNGAADGPFAYCGFRPKFVMLKRVDTGNANTSWIIHDAGRVLSNPQVGIMGADLGGVEVNTSTTYVDFLANGFKIRVGADDAHNQSSGRYIFAAFAEFPLKYANAR